MVDGIGYSGINYPKRSHTKPFNNRNVTGGTSQDTNRTKTSQTNTATTSLAASIAKAMYQALNLFGNNQQPQEESFVPGNPNNPNEGRSGGNTNTPVMNGATEKRNSPTGEYFVSLKDLKEGFNTAPENERQAMLWQLQRQALNAAENDQWPNMFGFRELISTVNPQSVAMPKEIQESYQTERDRKSDSVRFFQHSMIIEAATGNINGQVGLGQIAARARDQRDLYNMFLAQNPTNGKPQTRLEAAKKFAQLQLESVTKERDEFRNAFNLAESSLSKENKLSFTLKLKELESEAEAYKGILKSTHSEPELQKIVTNVLSSLENEVHVIESLRVEWGEVAQKNSPKYGSDNPWQKEFDRLTLASSDPQGQRTALRFINDILKEPKQGNVVLLKY